MFDGSRSFFSESDEAIAGAQVSSSITRLDGVLRMEYMPPRAALLLLPFGAGFLASPRHADVLFVVVTISTDGPGAQAHLHR